MRTNPGIAKARTNLETAKAKGSSIQLAAAVQKLQKSYKDAGVSIYGTVLTSLVQVPVTIGVFVAIRRMCTLPVEQLKHSGVSFMPDLTLAPGTEAFDPYYILPILSVLAVNYQLKLGLRDIEPEPPTSMHVMNCFRVLSPLMLAFTSFFPAGLLLSIMTGIICTGAQSLLLRLPRIRRKLELPRLPKQNMAPPSVMETLKYLVKKVREVYSSESSKQVATKVRSKSS
jgi:YidC/Oxa1 family membrane protein insertase